MSATWTATIGDAELEVSLHRSETDGGQRWILRCHDREAEIDAVRLPGGSWSVISAGRSFVVDVVTSASHPAGLTVHVDGREVAVEIEDSQTRRFSKMVSHAGGAAGKGEALRAPIAGKVVKVVASLGDEVAAGDPLVVLEAMKMENELRASRGGTVTSIEVATGDSVETHQLLVQLK